MFNFLARFRSVDSVLSKLTDLREQLSAVADRQHDVALAARMDAQFAEDRRDEAMLQAERASRIAARINDLLL